MTSIIRTSMHHFLVLTRLLMMFSLCNIGFAQTAVETKAKWQLSQELVMQGAQKKYQTKVDELQQAYLLDTDAQFLQDLQTILENLKRAAVHHYPLSASWSWEVHSSDQDAESSYCMAGGKLIVNRKQVKELALNQAQLVMLLAHEMAHALLLHHYHEDREALRLFPVWLNKEFAEFETAIDEDDILVSALAEFGKQQEFEADLAGLELALKANYSATAMLTFFEKLRKQSAHPNFDSRSHPSPTERLQRARDWASTALRQTSTPLPQ